MKSLVAYPSVLHQCWKTILKSFLIVIRLLSGLKVVLIVLIFVGIFIVDIDSGRRGDKGDDFFECHGEWERKKGCAAIVTFPSFCEPANLTSAEMM